MASISALLAGASLPDSATAQLDAELLLAFCLGKSRSYLRTWPEVEPTAEQCSAFKALLARRAQGEPVAYLLGKQGFWSLDLEVAPHTLIPRPDTELLVETALEVMPSSALQVLDLGTGTGAIALSLASERPLWQVMGVDRVPEAVALAERNAKRLNITNACFLQSQWFSALATQRYGLIVSNPPYIAKSDPHLAQGDVRFEPLSALVAGDDGLDDLRHIIDKSPEYLESGGWLLLEHGYDQGHAVRELLTHAGFTKVQSRVDLARLERISLGQIHQWS